jgi:hypothetical protein
MFYPRDHQIYDETYDVYALVAALKGAPLVIQDVFGFWLTDVIVSTTIPFTFVYRMRQVLADKLTGSGEEIEAGDRVYAVVAQNYFITANPGGTFGIDYYFCGWAKFHASADDTQVIINFDGTRYDEDI